MSKRNIYYILIWIALGLAVITAYSYKYELVSVKNRVIAAIIPGVSHVEAEKITVFKQNDGHFYIDCYVNGHKVKFLIDTGATRVTLSQSDADQILDLIYTGRYASFHTANGLINAPQVTIRDFRIGNEAHNIELKDMQSYVTQSSQSLLGMSGLAHFDAYTVDDDRMELYFK